MDAAVTRVKLAAAWRFTNRSSKKHVTAAVDVAPPEGPDSFLDTGIDAALRAGGLETGTSLPPAWNRIEEPSKIAKHADPEAQSLE